jgi:hypothetical protein
VTGSTAVAAGRRSSAIAASEYPAAFSPRFITTAFTAAWSVPSASVAHCGRALATSRPTRSIIAS